MDVCVNALDRPAHAPADHPAVNTGKVGVLLVNLGTPDKPDAPSVRRYLAEFLSDPRVVEQPRFLWLPILHGVILNVRPRRSARAYAKIWGADGESPLRAITRGQAEGVADRLGSVALVDWAMRYGNPPIAERLQAMKDAGCDRVLIMPLYPQYSATTTASVCDAAFDALKAMRWAPAVRVLPAFHDDPAYIEALAASARREIAKLEAPPERVLLSFHGIPKRYFQGGDPYHCHCAKTARLLRERMGWTEEFAPITFQSRFGPEEWLTPATDAVVRDLAEKGVKQIAVMTPGFIADCLETLEEIAIGEREAFEEAGGEHLACLPCLNDADEAITLLEILARRETSGWI